jgi:hypothetical protein
MSYTVGIKRRFLPGFRKIAVLAHSWENFRFLLNLVDGSQLVIPGFRVDAIKVYADFNDHLNLRREEQRRAAAEAELQALREKAEADRARNERVYKRVQAETTAPQQFTDRELFPIGHQETQRASEPQRQGINPFPQYTEQHSHGQESAQYPAQYADQTQPAQPSAQELEARRRANKRFADVFGSNGPAEEVGPRSPLS